MLNLYTVKSLEKIDVYENDVTGYVVASDSAEEIWEELKKRDGIFDLKLYNIYYKKKEIEEIEESENKYKFDYYTRLEVDEVKRSIKEEINRIKLTDIEEIIPCKIEIKQIGHTFFYDKLTILEKLYENFSVGIEGVK